MQVLYVDDDTSLAEIVELMLQGEGHVCHITDNGEQAVTLAKRSDYDIIILDIVLPDIDGYEVIQRVRAAGVKTPFLIQSGLVDRDNKVDGLGFGFDEFLVKPFNKTELTDQMNAVIARSKKGITVPPVPIPDPRGRPRKVDYDGRQHKRFTTLKYGRIANGDDWRACVVLNVSYGGAALWLLDRNVHCPSRFRLELPSGLALQCEVCWRLGDKLGVRFTSR